MILIRKSDDHPLLARLSALGLVLGALAFAASATPSLIPRSGLVQGALGGICFAIFYLLGTAAVALWNWIFERPEPAPKTLRRNIRVAMALAAIIAGMALFKVTGWQNDIHRVMNMPPVESARPFVILVVAVLVAGLLILIGRLFRRLFRVIAAQLERALPQRLSLTLGLGLAAVIFWSLGSDFIGSRVLAMLDKVFATTDAAFAQGQTAPSDPLKSGSAASLVGWNGLGAMGRDWVLGQPDAAAIAAVTGQPALEPLRVYVGLNNADTAAERADLALREALRVGAFDRGTMVIATPTGTGWMDPAGMRPLEYLTHGDVAVIGVQYSYLASWLSLFVQPEYGSDSARALFDAIYGHWRSLPPETRPRLFLFGLSLGTRNSEASFNAPEILNDPFQGALWAGPPFAATNWRDLVDNRRADSPAWAPRFGDGSVIRVTTQDDLLDRTDAPWGKVRFVYLEHPSDPIVFFTPSVLWRAPDWLSAPRGPDVSPSLRWIPLVTGLQLGFDMMTATSPPPGRGHVYAGRDYAAAWAEVLGSDWPADKIETLRRLLYSQGL